MSFARLKQSFKSRRCRHIRIGKTADPGEGAADTPSGIYPLRRRKCEEHPQEREHADAYRYPHRSPIVAALATVTPPAAAQASGDEKCSPDGYVMTCYATLKSWRKSLVNRCDAGGSSRSTRDDDADDRDDRRTSRTSGRRGTGDGDGGGSGRPEDGDRKCVAGQLLEFKRYDALPALTGWKPTGLC